MSLSFSQSLKTVLSQLFQYFSDEIPMAEKIHSEFKYKTHGSNFHYNVSCMGLENKNDRLQVFLNIDELVKLDHSPFIGKIAPNANNALPYDYCAFFYLNGDQKFSSLQKWADEQGFQKTVAIHSAPPENAPSPQ